MTAPERPESSFGQGFTFQGSPQLDPTPTPDRTPAPEESEPVASAQKKEAPAKKASEKEPRIACPACERAVAPDTNWMNGPKKFTCPDCGFEVAAHATVQVTADEQRSARAKAKRHED